MKRFLEYIKSYSAAVSASTVSVDQITEVDSSYHPPKPPLKSPVVSQLPVANTQQYRRRVPSVKWQPTIASLDTLIYPTATLTHDICNASAYYNNTRTNVYTVVDGKYSYGPYPIGTRLPSAGKHVIWVTFVPESVHLYESCTKYIEIFVSKGDPVLLWELPIDDMSIPYDTQLGNSYFSCKTYHHDDDGEYIYNCTSTDRFDIGQHVITVQYVPSVMCSNNYNRGKKCKSINVIGTTPKLVWMDDDGIYDVTKTALYYPYRLSASNYNVSVVVNKDDDDSIRVGTYIYEPKVFTTLNAGTHTLKVTFIPTDTTRFMSSSIVREIKINKSQPRLQWNRIYPVYVHYVASKVTTHTCKCLDTAIMGSMQYDPAIGYEYSQPGVYTIHCTFTPKDTKNYYIVSLSKELTVKLGNVPDIEWVDPLPLRYPAPLTRLECNARISGCPPGDFVYDPPVGTHLDAGVHVLRCSYHSRCAGIGDSYKEVKIEILIGRPVLTWNQPFDIIEGTKLSEATLCCSCSNCNEGTFTYTPLLHTPIHRLGPLKITALFTPTGRCAGNFTDMSMTIQIQVVMKGKLLPMLQWQNPSDIDYLTPLSAKELNATCNIPGTFKYIPTYEEVLDAGTHVLRVVFEPLATLQSTYKKTYEEVDITVLQVTPVHRWMPSLPSLMYKQPLGADQLCVEQTIPGYYDYTPDFGDILEAGEHVLTCKVTPLSKSYNPIVLTNTVLVGRCTPIIEWAVTIPTITYGQAIDCSLLYTAKLTYPPATMGYFEYSYKENEILNAGIHTITCRFQPADIINMYAGFATVTVTVIKKDPFIYWKSGLGMTVDAASLAGYELKYGSKLSKKYFDCKCSDHDDGEYIYSHQMNHIFPLAGKHDLIVTYIPTDTINWNSVALTKTFVVKSKRIFLDWSDTNSADVSITIPYADLLEDQNTIINKYKLQVKLHSNTSEADIDKIGGNYEYIFPSTGGDSQLLRVKVVIPDLYTDCYYQDELVRKLNVSLVVPVLSWEVQPHERRIAYGEPLSDDNLLVCSVSSPDYGGSITYMPPAGSFLSLGYHKIYAIFKPAESMTKNMKRAQISLEVYVAKAVPKMKWIVPCRHVYTKGHVLTKEDFPTAVVDMVHYQQIDKVIVQNDARRVIEYADFIQPSSSCIYNYCPRLGDRLLSTKAVVAIEYEPSGAAAFHYRKCDAKHKISIT